MNLAVKFKKIFSFQIMDMWRLIRHLSNRYNTNMCTQFVSAADQESAASITSEGEILGAKENSVMRFIVGPAHLVVSSSMVQRVHMFIKCANDHEYEPYSKPKKGNVKYYYLGSIFHNGP